MPLSLGDTQVLNKLADVLYPFLPGKPHPYADPRISFKGVAKDLKISRHWADGSKLPAICDLLALTYEMDKGRFATLIQEVVRRSLIYREGKDPLTRKEVDSVNELLLKLGMRLKQLTDPTFLGSLPGQPARKGPDVPKSTSPMQTQPVAADLSALRSTFSDVSSLPPTRRGFAFERFLNDLFHAFDLAPRGSFRLVGEQIDGSFIHGHDTYLVEAKWQGPKIGQADLLALSGKVSGKAQWARGACISLSGYSEDGLEAFARGKQTNLICLDGMDLHFILTGKASLPQVLHLKARRAAESNAAFVSVRDLFPHDT